MLVLYIFEQNLILAFYLRNFFEILKGVEIILKIAWGRLAILATIKLQTYQNTVSNDKTFIFLSNLMNAL